MQPLGDLSFIDLLPQRGENNNNFVSFISEEFVLMNYSGRYLIFDLKGKFMGQVKFQGQKEGFRGDLIKLKNVSDSGKFFVFQGPHFLTKAERAAQKAKKKAKIQMKKDAKKKSKAGGLAAVIAKTTLNAGNAVEKAQKKSDKLKSGGKKADCFYIFKLEGRTQISGKMEW